MWRHVDRVFILLNLTLAPADYPRDDSRAWRAPSAAVEAGYWGPMQECSPPNHSAGGRVHHQAPDSWHTGDSPWQPHLQENPGWTQLSHIEAQLQPGQQHWKAATSAKLPATAGGSGEYATYVNTIYDRVSHVSTACQTVPANIKSFAGIKCWAWCLLEETVRGRTVATRCRLMCRRLEHELNLGTGPLENGLGKSAMGTPEEFEDTPRAFSWKEAVATPSHLSPSRFEG